MTYSTYSTVHTCTLTHSVLDEMQAVTGKLRNVINEVWRSKSGRGSVLSVAWGHLLYLCTGKTWKEHNLHKKDWLTETIKFLHSCFIVLSGLWPSMCRPSEPAVVTWVNGWRGSSAQVSSKLLFQQTYHVSLLERFTQTFRQRPCLTDFVWHERESAVNPLITVNTTSVCSDSPGWQRPGEEPVVVM